MSGTKLRNQKEALENYTSWIDADTLATLNDTLAILTELKAQVETVAGNDQGAGEEQATEEHYEFKSIQKLLDVLSAGEYPIQWNSGFLEIHLTHKDFESWFPVVSFQWKDLLPGSSFDRNEYGEIKIGEGIPFAQLWDIIGSIFSFKKTNLPTVDEQREKYARRNSFLQSGIGQLLLSVRNQTLLTPDINDDLFGYIIEMCLPGGKEPLREFARPLTYGAPKNFLAQYAIENDRIEMDKDYYDNFDTESLKGLTNPLEFFLEGYNQKIQLYVLEKYNLVKQGQLKAFWNGAYLEFEVGGDRFPAGYVPKCYMRESLKLKDDLKRAFKYSLTFPVFWQQVLRIISKVYIYVAKLFGVWAKISCTWGGQRALSEWGFLSGLFGQVGKVFGNTGKTAGKAAGGWIGIIVTIVIDVLIAAITYWISNARQKKRFRDNFKSWEDWETEQKNLNVEQEEGLSAVNELSCNAVIAEVEKIQETEIKNDFSFAGVEVTPEMQAADTMTSFKEKRNLTDDAFEEMVAVNLATDEVPLSDELRAFFKKGVAEGQPVPIAFICEKHNVLYEMGGKTVPQEDQIDFSTVAFLGAGEGESKQPQFDIDPEAVKFIEEEYTEEEYWQVIEEGLRQYQVA